ncbi:conserved hypothetical protein [Histoplasma capsulatum G186AR]|uniref:Azaphilone pigments biosynthesis cluster protein L N-terminal domain-containing protein n=2 Tax=Ajellomyces capsulatus TaxID=5037 RepID=C0NDG8_AJECG|nr:uncharacterized protein HCBG_01164 [Histoplasma capsulatum G186AR]EEH11709.1 conserved hypothetical protein [Histoplasma capsulatum G186AR]KAG5302438.1 hypothetical protein I7I52_00085 [Histoplasma capsulatum]QSS72163.1 hypothetical protein I7I50_03246 [Histoplasma capsulatum G186AR]
MADPISIASGIITLAGFAFNSSKSLYQAVESFRSTKRAVRELKEELEALDRILQSLQEAVVTYGDELAGLSLPLLRCGKACKEFEDVINKCVTHSAGSKTSFRDWAKLTYMGEDIERFRWMLAGYKSTINIAIADATFRRSKYTAAFLIEYKDMIANTTSDLEDHLQDIENKLDSFIPKGAKMEHEDSVQWSRIQEERNSTQQCLQICTDALEHIDKLKPKILTENPTAFIPPLGIDTIGNFNSGSSKYVINCILQEYKQKLLTASSDLEKHAERLKARLEAMSQTVKVEETAEWEQIQEERNSLRQCLAICAEAAEQAKKAHSNEFEDVLSADDAHQVIVSTVGELISAKRITTGSRSAQWLGQMSDETLQQLSRDHIRGSEGPVRAERGLDIRFDQYGRGHQLRGKPSTVRSDSPAQPL